MAKDLIPQLAGIPRARHHDRGARRPANPAHGKAEPAQFIDRRLVGRGPDHLPDDLAAVRPLDRQVVQLVGAAAHHRLQPQLFRLFADPDPAKVVTADPAELVAAQAEQRAVVDHPAMVVAHGGIDDLTLAQLLHVARQHPLHQGFRIRPRHLPLAQGGQVQHHRRLAAGPVFLYCAVRGIDLRQPVTPVFHMMARPLADPGVKRGFLGHLRLRIGRGAIGDGAAELFRPGIGAHMDVRQIPAVRGRGVVRTGRVHADNVGQRPEQHIVARPRPGFIAGQHPM